MEVEKIVLAEEKHNEDMRRESDRAMDGIHIGEFNEAPKSGRRGHERTECLNQDPVLRMAI